ncbi:MAG: energy transducer TonB [bacterium]
MAIDLSHKTVITANDLFKAKYNLYLRWSAVTACFLTILMFLFSPKYVPNPYRLIINEMQAVNLDEVFELPPPPKDIPPPPKAVEAAPDEEVTEDVPIADTLMDLDDAIAAPTSDFGQGDGEVFVASSEKPTMVHFQSPHYPEMARISQLEGTVIVKVLVGPDGSVLDAQILQGVHPMLNSEAIKAAMKCKFNPGKQRNIPVKAWMAIPFRFRLH